MFDRKASFRANTALQKRTKFAGMRCELVSEGFACGTIGLVVDPPETHGSDSLTSKVQLNWRRRKIGRPGKAGEAMETSLKDTEKLLDCLKKPQGLRG